MADESPSGQVDEAQLVKGGYEKFAKPWNNSDVILVVEERKFHVHRAVLGIYSPVFLAMFSSEGFNEKNKDEIPLPDKKALELLYLLNQLYVDIEMCPITMKSIEHLLKLADEYQITVVMERCRRVLHAQSLNTDNALRILILGQKYNFEELRKKCYPVLKRLTLESLQSRPQYVEMDKESHRQVVTARLVESEKILPGIESLVWTFLPYVVKPDEVAIKCNRHKLSVPSETNFGAGLRKVLFDQSTSFPESPEYEVVRRRVRVFKDLKKRYAECPQCRPQIDSVISRICSDDLGIIKGLKMLGLCLPG